MSKYTEQIKATDLSGLFFILKSTLKGACPEKENRALAREQASAKGGQESLHVQIIAG